MTTSRPRTTFLVRHKQFNNSVGAHGITGLSRVKAKTAAEAKHKFEKRGHSIVLSVS